MTEPHVTETEHPCRGAGHRPRAEPADLGRDLGARRRDLGWPMMAAETRILTPAPDGCGVPTQPAGAGTLAFAIQRWEAAHPGFVRVLPCVEPFAMTVVPRSVRIAASRIGVTVAEYRQRQANGERWCSYGMHFAPDWWKNGRKTQTYCPEHMAPYRREAAALRRQHRKGAAFRLDADEHGWEATS